MVRTRIARSLAAAVAVGATLATPSIAQATPAAHSDKITHVDKASHAPVQAAGHRDRGHARPHTFAVIGDVPYGEAQIKAFPTWIQQINSTKPRMTFHVGDIKNGSTRCDDEVYTRVKSTVDAFVNPFIYTPGDNEWTDCHRANNGAYNPLERLAMTRRTFFADPGTTLGQHPMKVTSQDYLGVPENVRLEEHGVAFATVHVVGSNDDLLPWDGIGNTTVTPEQAADQARRVTAAIANIHDTYAQARRHHDRAVVVMMQADMFDPTYPADMKNDSAFKPIVQALVDEANRFRGESYLVNGDSHVYNYDQPMAAGSSWLDFYGIKGSAPIKRITTDGSSNNKDFLTFTINDSRRGPVLSWTRVPYELQVQG